MQEWRVGQSEWLMGGFEPNHPGSDLFSLRLWASWSESSCKLADSIYLIRLRFT